MPARSRRRLLSQLALLSAAALATGCSFRPLYGAGSPAAAMLGQVEVAPIEGAAGFALRERLIERLGPARSPRYRLEVALEFAQEGVAITRENITTRFNVAGAAAYRLVPLAGGAPAASGTLTALTGYSAPASRTASAFAALAASRDAEARLARTLAERIVLRLALAAGEPAP